MAVDIRKDLVARYGLLSKSIEDIEKKMQSLPEGRINIRTRNGNTYYYLTCSDSSDKYLSREDTKLIELLMQKNYLNRVLKRAKEELDALEKMLKLYPDVLAEDVFDQLSEVRKSHIKPINAYDDAYAQKWMAVPYKRKPFKKSMPEFYTTKGERVRSKSEVIIADRLRANGIPYRYECPLKVGKKIIHPDFTILRMSDMKILYHEHCGKMGDKEYIEDMLTRAKDYSLENIILGDRLFYTFESETTPLDIVMLDKLIIKHYR
ncbi:MAG: hypothetical protein IKE92_00870 [Clostridiales bacterium]|nr:hypothetical protein [Clostridiales bacterium]